MKTNLKIAILLTCHNRVKNTIQCLKKISNYTLYDIYLVDDGSTDNTSFLVKKQLPFVNIIQGSGNLFWNGGMRKAWDTALKEKEYNFYIWLNDDTYLYENAIDNIINDYNSIEKNTIIISGLCEDHMNSNKFSYGLRDHTYKPILPSGKPQKGKYLNGNFVLVPSIVVKKIGILSQDYTHGMGDYDYGLRLIEQGGAIYSSSNYLASCEPNGLPRWCNPNYSISQRWEHFKSPNGLNIKEYTLFRKRHWKKSWRFDIIKAYLKLIFPSIYPKK
ncbi:glycosyltransferase family 2 protein [Flammeovirga sp. OC4]|uniref:glycosyltransferase family 2 protein n=1 Tax=Flammeovirga sp. OC4 TaxID=1382345 RepID=UPI0005C59EEC|nr:glycosyltransferase [Flammeovirga sp. OC4]